MICVVVFLCIQPVSANKTRDVFLGTRYFDDAKCFIYDRQGNCYVAGYTSSEKLSSSQPPQKNFGSFVIKRTPQQDFDEVIYWLRGNGDSIIQSIQLDSKGTLWMAGTTTSSDLSPSLSFLQGKSDIFLAKYSEEKKAVDFIAYIGGTGKDECTGMLLDRFENPCIVGITDSNDFPGAGNQYAGKSDGIFIRYSPEESKPILSYYLGGEKEDTADDISFDTSGNTIIAGSTASIHFLKDYFSGSDGLQILKSPTRGKLDAFLIKLSPDTNQLLSIAILGGSQDEISLRTTVDLYGNLYLAGDTESKDFLDNSYHGGRDFFVVKMNSFGSQIIYSGIFGGKEWDNLSHFQIDRSGRIWMIGETRYSSIALELRKKYPEIKMNESRYKGGDLDGFCLTIQPLFNQCDSFGFLGGKNIDLMRAINVTKPDQIDLLGYTESEDFLSVSESKYQGNGDIFFRSIPKNPEAMSIRMELWVGKNSALIDDKSVKLENPPWIQNGRTFVPLRFIGDTLKADVLWSKETNTVRIMYANRFFTFHTKNNQWMKITYPAGDSEDIELDSAPLVQNGRMYVPLRAIGEGFGGKVTWEGTSKKVTITILQEAGSTPNH